MPGGMSGEQLAAAAKALHPRLPVLLLTGYGDLMIAAGERPECVDAVLPKPVNDCLLTAHQLLQLRGHCARPAGRRREDAARRTPPPWRRI